MGLKFRTLILYTHHATKNLMYEKRNEQNIFTFRNTSGQLSIHYTFANDTLYMLDIENIESILQQQNCLHSLN